MLEWNIGEGILVAGNGYKYETWGLIRREGSHADPDLH